jgi:hypothetical protein
MLNIIKDLFALFQAWTTGTMGELTPVSSIFYFLPCIFSMNDFQKIKIVTIVLKVHQWL